MLKKKDIHLKQMTIKEKIENEGFRQKEEKSLSGLSIIGC